MTRNEDSVARVRLAGRILTQITCGGGQPILPAEIAHLRFLAESDSELAMPVGQLAQTIIERERGRMGIPPPRYGFGSTNRN